MAWPGLAVRTWIISKAGCNCRTKNFWRNAVLWWFFEYVWSVVMTTGGVRGSWHRWSHCCWPWWNILHGFIDLDEILLSEHVNAHNPEAFASEFSRAAASIVIIVKISDHKKKYDLWGKIELSPAATHFLRSLQCLIILLHWSASSHVTPFSTDPSKYIAPLCNGQWPHCTSVHSNYVFTVSRSRRWGIWVILSVRDCAQC